MATARKKSAPRKIAAKRKAATRTKAAPKKKQTPATEQKLPGFLYIREPEGCRLTVKEKARFKKLIHAYPPQHFIQSDAASILTMIDIELRIAELRTMLRDKRFWLTENDKGDEQEHPYVKMETRWISDREKLAKQLRIHPTDRDRLFGYGNAVPVEPDPEGESGQVLQAPQGRRLVYRESDVVEAEYTVVDD